MKRSQGATVGSQKTGIGYRLGQRRRFCTDDKRSVTRNARFCCFLRGKYPDVLVDHVEHFQKKDEAVENDGVAKEPLARGRGEDQETWFGIGHKAQ